MLPLMAKNLHSGVVLVVVMKYSVALIGFQYGSIWEEIDCNEVSSGPYRALVNDNGFFKERS